MSIVKWLMWIAEIISIHKKLWSKGSKNDLFIIQVEYSGQEEIENIHLISSNNREEMGLEVGTL